MVGMSASDSISSFSSFPLPDWLDDLLNPASYVLMETGIEPGDVIASLETHVSQILLVGRHAFKRKKPVSLGFLDYADLAQRQWFCEQELVCNAGLSDGLYIGVAAVTSHLPVAVGQSSRILIKPPALLNAEDQVLEWLVQMHRFEDHSLALECVSDLQAASLSAFAQRLAYWHQQAPVSDQSAYGSLDANLFRIRENLHGVAATEEPELTAMLADLEKGFTCLGQRLAGVFDARQQQGFIRHCHGDLHLGNLAWWHEHWIAFDAIEFNPSLAWIDVLNDLAFLLMDLMARHREDLVLSVLSAYLEVSRDRDGLVLLPFYCAYRASVRAKIESIRMGQLPAGSQARDAAFLHCRQYLELTNRLLNTPLEAWT